MELNGLRGLPIVAFALMLVHGSYQQLPINCTFSDTGIFGLTIPPFSPGDTIFSDDCASIDVLEISSFPQTAFPAGILDPLTSLTTLYIDSIRLESVEANAFSALGQLTFLNLEDNLISDIDVDAFNDLTSLQTLHIGNNGVTSLPANAFQDLGALTFLDFGFNNITNIDAGAFIGLTSLIQLDLEENGLTTLTPNVFQGLVALTTLNLDFNALSTIDIGAFTGLLDLLILSLANNNLTTLPANVFQGPDTLSILDLSDNMISNVDEDAFNGLSTLGLLNFISNSLTTLPENVFQNQGELSVLALNSNQIDFLPFEIFSPLSALQSLLAVGNNLECLPPNVAIFRNPSAICDAPPPPPPLPPTLSPPAQVISDPHFRGFRGQEFDVIGHAGSIYSLIEDTAFSLRIKLAKALNWFDVRKASLDSEGDDLKTWISEVGLAITPGHSVFISVLDSSENDNLEFSRSIDAVFKAGVVEIDGTPMSRVGTISIEDDDDELSKVMSIALENSKSFGRVTITTTALTLQVDIVLPRKEWKVSEAEYGLYSHINLNFISINLTPSASGILGDTQRPEFAFASGYEEKYAVESIL